MTEQEKIALRIQAMEFAARLPNDDWPFEAVLVRRSERVFRWLETGQVDASNDEEAAS